MCTHKHISIYSQRQEQDDAFGTACICVSICVYNVVYICALCECSCWKHMPKLITGWTWRHGAAAVALPLSGYQI